MFFFVTVSQGENIPLKTCNFFFLLEIFVYKFDIPTLNFSLKTRKEALAECKMFENILRQKKK